MAEIPSTNVSSVTPKAMLPPLGSHGGLSAVCGNGFMAVGIFPHCPGHPPGSSCRLRWSTAEHARMTAPNSLPKSRRNRDTRSATSPCGCCAAAPARRCCSCTAPTACRCGCRCSSCCRSSSRCCVPEHPGFGTSDNPPWMRNIGDLAMYYLDFLDGLGADHGASGRAVARRLGRGRGRGAQLRAARKPHAAGAGGHPHQGRALRRQLHLGARGGGAQPLPRPVDRRPHAGDAGVRRGGRPRADQPLRRHQVRLGAALVQSVAGALAAPHHACRR